ncbi:MAG: sodium:proton antiporter, partial [Gammaproteobacteria bacterium]|nr:sodium:proton antiporter [Gammaproteobacteria bacterium]NIO61472.1 sodium:proton antiporter [Gammaproteobacteria bacterium]
MGLVIGALASATAPAVILAMIREYKAKGALTTTLLSVVAFDDALAIIFFSVALGIGLPLSLGEGTSLYQM